MKMASRLSALTILVFLLSSEPILAGTEEWLDPRAIGSIAVGCSNPEQILQLQTSTESTEVLQIGRFGVNWRSSLPPIQEKNGNYYLSTYGDAAVVVTALRSGEAFLVLAGAKKVPIDDGYVYEVHFEGGRALVVTGIPGEHELESKRVRVYDVGSGDLVFDRRIDDVALEEDRPLERQWYVKPTLDGRGFFYVRTRGPHAGTLAVMDVATGRVKAVPLRRTDHHEVLEVIDALFPTPERGFVASGIDGVLLADRHGLRSLDAPTDIGSIEHLYQSARFGQLAAVGMKGWALYDLAQGRWSTIEVVGYALTVRATQDGWSVLDTSARDELRIFDTTSGEARLAKTTKDVRKDLVCYNAHGIMQKRDASLRWRSADTPSL